MKLKEFYQLIPSTGKNILSQVNTSIVSSIWTATGTGINVQQLNSMSEKLFVSNMYRELSPVITDYCEMMGYDIESLTSAQWTNILNMLYQNYRDKWTKLFNNIFLQSYNPIWNVDGSESEIHEFTHGKTTTETRNLSSNITYGKTETETVNLSDRFDKNTSESKTVNQTVNNKRNGFSSPSSVPVGDSTTAGTEGTTNSGYDTDTHTGTNTIADSGVDSERHTGSDVFANSGVDTEEITKTRGGNIGVTSTQNMLTQEYEFRMLFNYFDVIMKDIIKELTLNIYI